MPSRQTSLSFLPPAPTLLRGRREKRDVSEERSFDEHREGGERLRKESEKKKKSGSGTERNNGEGGAGGGDPLPACHPPQVQLTSS